MPRRTPNGETDVEVLADYARKLERRLADLEGMVAGRLPHDHDAAYASDPHGDAAHSESYSDAGHLHDARYVEAAGDTMTGDLFVTALRSGFSIAIDNPDSSGDLLFVRRSTGAGRWVQFRVLNDDEAVAQSLSMFSGDDPTNPGLARFSGDLEVQGSSTVGGDFDVSGSKNARIADPDDPTRAYHYAAMEADEPGLLAHRWLNVHVDREATFAVPEHWGRIARDPMVMVSHASEPDDSSPRAPFGWADLGAGQVTVRAPKGSYHVLLIACRSDLDGRWSHEVAVDPDEGDDV